MFIAMASQLLRSSSVGAAYATGAAHQSHAAPTELGFDLKDRTDYKHGAPNGACARSSSITTGLGPVPRLSFS